MTEMSSLCTLDINERSRAPKCEFEDDAWDEVDSGPISCILIHENQAICQHIGVGKVY